MSVVYEYTFRLPGWPPERDPDEVRPLLSVLPGLTGLQLQPQAGGGAMLRLRGRLDSSSLARVPTLLATLEVQALHQFTRRVPDAGPRP